MAYVKHAIVWRTYRKGYFPMEERTHAIPVFLLFFIYILWQQTSLLCFPRHPYYPKARNGFWLVWVWLEKIITYTVLHEICTEFGCDLFLCNYIINSASIHVHIFTHIIQGCVIGLGQSHAHRSGCQILTNNRRTNNQFLQNTTTRNVMYVLYIKNSAHTPALPWFTECIPNPWP